MEDYDDEGCERVKEEPSFLNLDPAIKDIEWKENLYPIEVHLHGEINSDSVSEFETTFREAQRSGQKEIPLVIHSVGGDMYDALKIVDLILTSAVPVTTIVRGAAMSAAVMIFSCGEQRIIGPHASIMIHSVHTGYMGGKLGDVKVETQEMERLTELMAKILSDNTGKQKGFFLKKFSSNTDCYMSPEEAIKCNLATQIGDARLRTSVTVNSAIEVIPYKKRKRR